MQPDLVLKELVFPHLFRSGGLFLFTDTGSMHVNQRDLEFNLLTCLSTNLKTTFPHAQTAKEIGMRQVGSALMVSLQISCFRQRDFLCTPVKIHHFCSGPISVDPVCPQPRKASNEEGTGRGANQPQ